MDTIETKIEEDETFLIIVGDEQQEIYEEYEVLSDTEESNEYIVPDFIQNSPEHGQILEVKVERIGDETWDQIGDENFSEQPGDEFSELRMDIADGFADDDTKYEDPVSLSDFEDSLTNKDNTNTIHRTRPLKPHEERSLVKKLRKQYPQLNKDTKRLVHVVGEMMKNVKNPEIPDGTYEYDEGTMICNLCKWKTTSMPNAERHYLERHGPRYLLCFACGVNFRSRGTLYRHEKRCASKDAKIVLKARALILGNLSRSRPYIPKHIPQIKPKFNCSYCSASFASKRSLESHTNLHMGLRPYRCKHCPAAYTSHPALVKHERKHEYVNIYMCDHCGESYKQKYLLARHIQTHSTNSEGSMAPYACNQCASRFSYSTGLREHVRKVHDKLPAPHVCPVCGERFGRTTWLSTHMQKKHQMNILTRTSFLRKLPMLSDSEMKQYAMVMFEKDVKSLADAT